MPENHLLAIPVYNEERYVTRILDEVRCYSRNILVIDDGSSDGTAAILSSQPDISLVSHAQNQGYGQSLAEAFAFARRLGYRWLITMDADDQHEPGCIPRFVRAAATGGVDVISGTRYPAGHRNTAAPPDRREINRKITAMLNRRLGLAITDAFCGFKAYRVEALRHIRVTVPGYAMPMQWWVQAARAGLRIEELKVPLIYGDSKRCFGGLLDDARIRLAHYLEVFEAEMASVPVIPEPVCRPACRAS